jgi:integrase
MEEIRYIDPFSPPHHHSDKSLQEAKASYIEGWINNYGQFDKLKRPALPPDAVCTLPAPARVKYTVKDINDLVKAIRARQTPKLSEDAREEHYHDPALKGFYIRLLNTGVASWVLQWKRLGRQKKITLGDVRVLDRLEALKAAKELLAKITLSVLDPHEARRERMRAAKVTLEIQVPLFMQQKKLRRSTERAWNRYFTGYYFKPLHNLPIDEITSDQIQTQIDTIANQSGDQAAHAACAAMSVFFNWAIRTRKLPQGHHNPMVSVQSPAMSEPRERVLTDDEIRLIWKTCDVWEAAAVHETQRREAAGTATPHNAICADYPRAIKLLFLTGCRAQEIGDLKWSEVDLDNAELFIPGSRRKARKKQEKNLDLSVPLADWAVKILRNIERQPNYEFVFGHSHKKNPGVLLNETGHTINLRITNADGKPPPHWRVHDIRRTFRTRLAALKVTSDIAERLVGHISHRTSRTYNRYEYWADKRTALTKWEDHLRAVIDGTAEKFASPHFGQRKDKTA